jgi:hypothetical protein
MLEEVGSRGEDRFGGADARNVRRPAFRPWPARLPETDGHSARTTARVTIAQM